MNMPVQEESHLGDFDAPILRTSGMCMMFLLMFKECMSDSVTNYNYVGDTKISVSIKKTNANKCARYF